MRDIYVNDTLEMVHRSTDCARDAGKILQYSKKAREIIYGYIE